MTAPAAIVASFVQPAARLAMGDAVGGAMGGFEALLAMLTQSLQGGAEGQVPGQATPKAAPETDAETPAETGDLAALLAGAGQAAWLAHTLSRTMPEGEEGAAPVTCDVPQTGAMVDAATVLPEADETGEAVTPDQAQPPAAPTALEALLRQQAPEAVAAARFQRDRTEPNPISAQARESILQAVQAPAEAAAVLATAEEQTPAPAETVAVPQVIAPPVEAKAQPATRKAAAAENKAVKVETADVTPGTVKVAQAGDDLDPLADETAPAPVAAREAETAQAPARHGADAAVQAVTTRLEAVAAGATAFATQVRGAPETVAKLAAGILDKLEGRSTKFDLQLDPHGLGKVDVSVEIASDGKLTAQLGFDSQLGMSELRGRAQELRTALEQAGFSLADNALSFDFTGERRQQQTAEEQPNRTAGAAFARAMSALDEDLAAAPTRYQARQGLDLLI